MPRFNHRKRFTSACTVGFMGEEYKRFNIHWLERVNDEQQANINLMFKHMGRGTVPYYISRKGFRLLAYGPFISKKEAKQWVDVLLEQPPHRDWLNRAEAAFEAMKALGVLQYELAL